MSRILLTGTGSVMGLSIYDALISSHLTKEIPLVLTNSLGVSAPGLRSRSQRPQDLFLVAPEAKDSSYSEYIVDLIETHEISIVYPGTQHELGKLSLLRDLGCPIASPSSRIVNLCSDKFSLWEYLSSMGVSHPKTWLLSTFMNVSGDEAKFILKPRSGSASRGLQILNKSEIEKAAASISNAENWIVQEYLEGDEYTCSVFRDKIDSTVKTLVMRRELSTDGASISGVVEDNQDIERYLHAVADALVEFGWDFGNVNIQLRLSESGLNLFEINPRLSSTESPKAKMGFDTVTAYFQNMVQNEVSILEVPSPGTSFLRYYADIVYNFRS